jgi:hypothetical protein
MSNVRNARRYAARAAGAVPVAVRPALREHMGKVCFDLAKAAFSVLFFGGIAVYYGREGYMSTGDMWMMLGLGVMFGGMFGILGYMLLNQQEDER